MSIRRHVLALAAATALTLGAGAAQAQVRELRFMCSGDGNECQVMDELLRRFEAQNPTIRVKVDSVPYKAILESLPVQLAAGEGPDLARVTDLGGLNRYYLDIAPFVTRTYWEESFGDTLQWFRAGEGDQGIYGLMTQLTVTGAFANKTLFEQANVPLPGEKATWDEWADAVRKVAKATQTPFGMALDRSGHRIAGPAISYGAKFFAADGSPKLADAGFKELATRFVRWNQDGTMAKDVWAGSGGGTYQDAAQEFINGKIVVYYSGSWQIGKFDKAIGDGFDWVVVGSPCGPAGCSGMPGGSALVGFKQTRHPEAVAKVIDFFAQPDVHEELIVRTSNIPAHRGLAAKGLAYPQASKQASAALQGFGKDVADLSPTAYKYQGYKYNRSMFQATAARLTQAIVGELTLDDALARMDKDVADAIAAAEKKQ
jgi:alpha-1,4-digalacturonate transport system substrate-binding protein